MGGRGLVGRKGVGWQQMGRYVGADFCCEDATWPGWNGVVWASSCGWAVTMIGSVVVVVVVVRHVLG